MSSKARGRRNRKFKTKKLPQTGRRIDQRQNKAIMNLSKKVKKIEGDEEVKHKDTAHGVTAVTTAGLAWESHNFISQGTTNITRIGNVIAPTSYQIRFRLNAGTGKITTDSHVRMIIFWDTQVNNAGPDFFGVDGLLDDSVITNNTFSPRNYNTVDRYKILKDKIWTLRPMLATTTTPADGVVAAVSAVTISRTYIIKTTKRMRFTGNAGTVADISNNALYVLWITDLAALQPQVQGSVRMYFKDT